MLRSEGWLRHLISQRLARCAAVG
eukprot:COSAG01_NODE_71758_length_255_cov_0.506410_1_plen_23_part_01